jgi:hypothetical protein
MSNAQQAAGVARQQAFVAGKPWWTLSYNQVAEFFHTGEFIFVSASPLCSIPLHPLALTH